MYCARCGTENPDGANYCRNCGAALRSAPPSAAPASSPGPAPEGPGGRVPLMAAVLNLLFGLGYVYLGYSRVMRVQVAVFVLLMIAVYFLAGIASDGLVSLIIGVLLAVDGYQKASGLAGYISAERGAPIASDRA